MECIRHTEMTGWISAKKKPVHSGLYEVRSTSSTPGRSLVAMVEFSNGQWVSDKRKEITLWRGQATNLRAKEGRELRYALKRYQDSRSNEAYKAAASIAALRLGRYFTGPSKRWAKGNRIKAFKFFIIAERLGAPIEPADRAYIQQCLGRTSESWKKGQIEATRKAATFVTGDKV